MSRPSRVSVGNLLNHTTTTQNTNGPVAVPPPQTTAPPVVLPQPQLQVYRFVEYGREFYAVNGGIAYPFPCDDEEDEKLDMFHHLIHQIAFSGRLHHADLKQRGNQRARILDLGHATGIWVYEMAKATEWADVVGIDLHSRTPARDDSSDESKLTNASFQTPVDFSQHEWPFPPNSHDLIRMSQLCGSVADWYSLYQTVVQYLKPGSGYVEHIEIDWTPRCSEGASFPLHAAELLQWWRDMQNASRIFGKPIDCPSDAEHLLQRCGFADVTHRTVQVPLWAPQKFEKDDEQARRQHHLCWFFKIAMCSPTQENPRVPPSFEGLTMSLFTRQLRMRAADVAALCDRLRAIISNDRLPMYFNLHVWTARRPRS